MEVANPEVVRTLLNALERRDNVKVVRQLRAEVEKTKVGLDRVFKILDDLEEYYMPAADRRRQARRLRKLILNEEK